MVRQTFVFGGTVTHQHFQVPILILRVSGQSRNLYPNLTFE
jgi:hypothetical protein